jgi:UDP-N-acetyl-D-glucosamine dehydrogenase
VAEVTRSGAFSATSDFSRIRETSAVIICVPTPLNKNREPDISYILDTGRNIARNLQKGMLVVLESTTYPGTTDEDLREVLEIGSGLEAGKDFHLAFSPEREDPGNPNSKVSEIPKVIGGLTPACLEKAVALYSRAIKTVVPVSSCRAAEATKLLENIFRSVNIALVNELKVVYGAMDIDIWEVINAAKTKPFGFMPFYPGPGLGGHCIPIDPFYLSWKAKQSGFEPRFIELAGCVNSAMPHAVVDKITAALNVHRKPLNGSHILVAGVAYKRDIDDIRESPSLDVMGILHDKGARLSYIDPYVPVLPARAWPGSYELVSTSPDRVPTLGVDCLVVLTDHRAFDYESLVAATPLVVDTRNAIKQRHPHVFRLGAPDGQEAVIHSVAQDLPVVA